MEDLQSALQSILSDPEQMARIQEMAASLGLNPPPEAEPSSDSQPEQPAADGQLLAMIQTLGGIHGTEERVFSALRPGMSQKGKQRVDKALRAAKLSRLAGTFLNGSGLGHV